MDKLSKEKNTEHSSNAHFTKNERIYYRAPLYHSRSACDRTAVGRKVSRIQLASEVPESPFAVYSTVEPLEISAPATMIPYMVAGPPTLSRRPRGYSEANPIAPEILLRMA